MTNCKAWVVLISLFWVNQTNVARTQDVDADEVKTVLEKVANEAIFHVSVSGKLANGNDSQPRTGKAFAVGPNLLITSRHVLGDNLEWKRDESVSKELRAARPVIRTIKLFGNEPHPTIDRVVVQPMLSIDIDAAGLITPENNFSNHFQLSLCDIKLEDFYFGIVTKSLEPSDTNSVRELSSIKLTAKGHTSAAFDPLFVFKAEGDADFKPNPDGHDGSPIVDSHGRVVAIISAVVVSGNENLVLATPVQPSFPGASTLLLSAIEHRNRTDEGISCSLADTVRQIKDQVVKHASWNARYEFDEDGKRTGIVLFYDSVSDTPNIKAISIDYSFIGPQKQNGNRQVTLKYNDVDDLNRVDIPQNEVPIKSRKFKTTKIIDEGRDVVEPFLREDGKGGEIDHVRITINGITLSDNTILNTDTTFDIKW